ncbi:MAG TPA: tetratricopeptide repeat protein [Flavipsychrobacter sp.]|nr:tetratricopeptide repeat protein [Flavipsychrobacter sp.]
MQAIADDRHSCKLKSAVSLFKGDMYYKFGDATSSLKFLQAAMNTECSDVVAAQAEILTGLVYNTIGIYTIGYEYLIRGDEKSSKIGYNKFRRRSLNNQDIASALYFLTDYRGAIERLNMELEYNESRENINIYNSLGIYYKELKLYDSAYVCFSKALNLAIQKKVQNMEGLTSGNIGAILQIQGKYTEAIPYLRKDVEISLKTKFFGSAVQAASALAEIYMKKNNRDSALVVLETVKPYLFRDINYLPAEGWYFSMFQYHKYSDNNKAVKYVDSFLYFKKINTKERDASLAGKIYNQIKIEKHLNSIKFLEEKETRLRIILTSIFIIAFLGVAVALERIKRIKQEQRFALANYENAKMQLSTYIKNVRQKTELLEKTQAELEELKSTEHLYAETKKFKSLEALREMTILTEQDWGDFKKTFTSVYPEFFMRLHLVFPDLTKGEHRFLSLTRIGLSTNEMANVLGVSPESVRKMKLRLRKKTGLSEVEIISKIS